MEVTTEHDARSGFRYLKFVPSSPPRPATAVVHLHGAGERGDELSLVTRFGLPAMLAQGRASANCRVLCPQLEEGGLWQPDRLATYLQSVTFAHECVSLIGFSLGALGVCNLTAAHGAVVAFAMAIAGQGPDRVQVSQAGVRLLAVQGELDPWPNTGGFLASVRAGGGQAFGVQLAGRGHFISEEALFEPTAMAMLLAAGVRIEAAIAG